MCQALALTQRNNLVQKLNFAKKCLSQFLHQRDDINYAKSFNHFKISALHVMRCSKNRIWNNNPGEIRNSFCSKFKELTIKTSLKQIPVDKF